MVEICQEGHSQRSAPQKRHMVHLRMCAGCTPRKLSSRDGGGDKSQPSPGVTVLTKHLVTIAAWNWEEHKTQAQPSLCLWSNREPEPEWLRSENCIQLRNRLRQFLAEQPKA